LANIILNLPFSFPNVDPRVPVGATHGVVDEVLDAGICGGIGDVFALLNLSYAARGVILDAEDAVYSLHCGLDGSHVFQVAFYDLDAPLRERLSRVALRIACKRPKLPALFEHPRCNCSALLSGSSGDQDLLFSAHFTSLPPGRIGDA